MKQVITPIEYHERTIVDSMGRHWPVARVAIIKKYVRQRRIPLSKKNIFTRDGFKCVYCGGHDTLTVDHVVPTSKGGKHIWTNVVTACKRCNHKKGNRILENPIYPTEPNPLGFGLDLTEWPEYDTKKSKTTEDSSSRSRATEKTHSGYSS